MGILLGACLLSVVASAAAHSRLVCPPPRNSGVGLKSYPCGSALDGQQPAFSVAPGPFTVVWEEAVAHRGAPARLALSLDGSDDGFELCTLLDHIPHREGGTPLMGLSFTYTQTRLTVNIPDVSCERCTLQLTSMMSDALHGVPAGTRCVTRGPDTAPGAAAANTSLLACPTYHSCATLRITGRTPRGNYSCPAQPQDWPYAAQTPAVYDSAADSAEYNRAGWLLSAPAAYRTPAGHCQLAGRPPYSSAG